MGGRRVLDHSSLPRPPRLGQRFWRGVVPPALFLLFASACAMASGLIVAAF